MFVKLIHQVIIKLNCCIPGKEAASSPGSVRTRWQDSDICHERGDSCTKRRILKSPGKRKYRHRFYFHWLPVMVLTPRT